MGCDRRRRPRRRPARDDRRHALRGKHKASFTPHVDCGDNVIIVNAEKVRAHRPQARRQGLLPPHRLHRRHQGAHRGPISRATSPSGSSRRRSSACCRAARSAGSQMRQPARLQGAGASPCRPEPRTPRRRRDEPQEREERLIMAETIQSLDQLSASKPAVPEAPKYVQKLDTHGRAYATGKRKDAVARVWLKPRHRQDHRQRPRVRGLFRPPGAADDDPAAARHREPRRPVRRHRHVTGGGLSGQAGAVRHGLSKALTHFEPELRGVLKTAASSPATAASVERKKYGKAKARRIVPVLQALSCHEVCLCRTGAASPRFVFRGQALHAVSHRYVPHRHGRTGRHVRPDRPDRDGRARSSDDRTRSDA